MHSIFRIYNIEKKGYRKDNNTEISNGKYWYLRPYDSETINRMVKNERAVASIPPGRSVH